MIQYWQLQCIFEIVFTEWGEGTANGYSAINLLITLKTTLLKHIVGTCI